MNTLKNEEATIGELVAQNYKTAEVFKNYGIDFCCGGKKKLSEVCDGNHLLLEKINTDLLSLSGTSELSSQDYNAWPLDFLADYIVNTHHAYINRSIPFISECTVKVANVHGNRNPEAIEIAELFREATDELTTHMLKEENILFPYIKKLVQRSPTDEVANPFGTVQNPIHMMELEHEDVGNIFKKIAELSNNYTPPANACATFRISYLKLKEFETDLHQHIHLENNILFPKAIQLEKHMFE